MAITWSQEKHGSGNETIDRQHRWLFDRLNGLTAACAGDSSLDELEQFFDFLDVYVLEHFSAEETLMEKVACPLKERNQREHAHFVQEFGALREQMRTEGPSPELACEVSGRLADWFENHVIEVDLKMLDSRGTEVR